MAPDKLIIGNPYIWVDENGQSRSAIYDGTCPSGYKFRVRGYKQKSIAIPEEEVRRTVFRTSITPLM